MTASGGISDPARFRAMTKPERAAYVKDHGLPTLDRRGLRRRLVEPLARPLIERLSRGAVGWCHATAASLRRMLFEDHGYLFGERSIPRWIWRAVRRGQLLHKRIPPGARFHRTGRPTNNGTQLNRYEGEAERRERLWREKHEQRKRRRARAQQRPKQAPARPSSPERAARLLAPPTPATPPEPLEASPDRWRGLLEAVTPIASSAPSSEPSPLDAERAAWLERREQETARARAWALEHEPPSDD